jgi:hypothetical protein
MTNKYGWTIFKSAWRRIDGEDISKNDCDEITNQRRIGKSQRGDFYVSTKSNKIILCEFTNGSGNWDEGHQGQIKTKADHIRKQNPEKTISVVAIAGKFEKSHVEFMKDWNEDMIATKKNVRWFAIECDFISEADKESSDGYCLRPRTKMLDTIPKENKKSREKIKGTSPNSKIELSKRAIGSLHIYEENNNNGSGRQHLKIPIGKKCIYMWDTSTSGKVNVIVSKSVYKDPEIIKVFNYYENHLNATSKRAYGLSFNSSIEIEDSRINELINALKEKMAKFENRTGIV